MRKMFILILLLPYSVVTIAQTIPNADFETWRPSGKPAPFNWEEPEGWITNNEAVEFTSAGVRKSTESYTGDFASRLNTVNDLGICRNNVK